MAPFAAGGIMLWAVAGLVLLAARTWFDAAVPARWLWICLAGVLLGFVGLAVMIRHDAHRRRRRAEDSS